MQVGAPGEVVREEQRLLRQWRRRLVVVGAVAAVTVVLFVWQVGKAWGGGSYEFIAVQGDYPVTWNRCHAIEYQVNPKGAPEGWEETVEQAVAEVEAASGFVFADRGQTTRTQLTGHIDARNKYEPVLIVWSDRYMDQMLDGGTVGWGGSVPILVDGRSRFVVGMVQLDTEVRDPKETRMILEHELGHVLGLDHVNDPSQLMYREYHGQDSLGSGDVNGLKELHDVPC